MRAVLPGERAVVDRDGAAAAAVADRAFDTDKNHLLLQAAISPDSKLVGCVDDKILTIWSVEAARNCASSSTTKR